VTVSQVADAMEVSLSRKIEGLLSSRQLKVLADRLAADIVRTQRRNRAARISAIKRRIRDLRKQGVFYTQTPTGDLIGVSL